MALTRIKKSSIQDFSVNMDSDTIAGTLAVANGGTNLSTIPSVQNALNQGTFGVLIDNMRMASGMTYSTPSTIITVMLPTLGNSIVGDRINILNSSQNWAVNPLTVTTQSYYSINGTGESIFFDTDAASMVSFICTSVDAENANWVVVV